MTVALSDDGTVRLEGVCPLEDAEVLLRRLCEDPQARVDWSGCEQLHVAVIQVLLAARSRMLGVPKDPFLRTNVARWMSGA